jgi:hypothetical protein
MPALWKYPAQDRDLVDEDLFEGHKTIERVDLNGDLKPLRTDADLETVGNRIDSVVDGDEDFNDRAEIDAAIAPVLHRSLGISRQQASQPGLWHWMAIMWRPDFVRYRWPYDTTNRTYDSMREKFLGAGTDIYSNAFGRLWWMAELSYDDADEDPYAVTRDTLEYQFLANRVFDPAFARYRPAVVAFADVLSEEKQQVIRHANRRFNQALSTIQTESLDTDQLQEIVEEVVAAVKADYDV